MFPGAKFFRKTFNRKKVIANGIFPSFPNWIILSLKAPNFKE